MTGNRAGGLKAYKKNIANDPNFYRKIGRKGGLSPKTKPSGFAVHRDLARIVGRKGGSTSGYKRKANRV